MSRKCESRIISVAIRKVFSAAGRKWLSVAQVAEAIGATSEQTRRPLARAANRGELTRRYVLDDSNREIAQYRYAAPYIRGRVHPVRARILKAIYVAETFTVYDIERLSGIDRSYINRVVLRLRRAGHLAQAGRRYKLGAHNPAPVYHVTDRDRFRVEVMG